MSVLDDQHVGGIMIWIPAAMMSVIGLRLVPNPVRAQEGVTRRTTMTIPTSRGSQAAGPVSRWAGAVLIAAVAGASAAGPSASAAEPGVTVSDAWMRMIIPSRPAAGYLTLSNQTDKPLVLTGAASPACGSLMVHRSVHENGQERMEMAMSVAIPAHADLKFEPGGYHLMCMTPSKDMTPGQSVPVTLRFEDGGTLTASFNVRGATGN